MFERYEGYEAFASVPTVAQEISARLEKALGRHPDELSISIDCDEKPIFEETSRRPGKLTLKGRHARLDIRFSAQYAVAKVPGFSAPATEAFVRVDDVDGVRFTNLQVTEHGFQESISVEGVYLP
jgi:hypothetical protein